MGLRCGSAQCLPGPATCAPSSLPAPAAQAHHGCWAPVPTAPRAATSATPPSSVSRGLERSTAVAACQVCAVGARVCHSCMLLSVKHRCPPHLPLVPVLLFCMLLFGGLCQPLPCVHLALPHPLGACRARRPQPVPSGRLRSQPERTPQLRPLRQRLPRPPAGTGPGLHRRHLHLQDR